MAGRGRGKPSSTFTQEQLQSMGVSVKDLPAVASAPPPLYPILLNKPVALESNPDRDYKILWKEDFISYLRESPYHPKPKNIGNKSQISYTDRVVDTLENDIKTRSRGEFIWNLMPTELKPNFKRVKKTGNVVETKKIKVVDINSRLKELEQKENLDKPDIKKEKLSDSEDDNGDEEEEDIPDEEMDEDNDYGNNYFDNGEAYNEEDDNLDDGPTY